MLWYAHRIWMIPKNFDHCLSNSCSEYHVIKAERITTATVNSRQGEASNSTNYPVWTEVPFILCPPRIATSAFTAFIPNTFGSKAFWLENAFCRAPTSPVDQAHPEDAPEVEADAKMVSPKRQQNTEDICGSQHLLPKYIYDPITLLIWSADAYVPFAAEFLI